MFGTYVWYWCPAKMFSTDTQHWCPALVLSTGAHYWCSALDAQYWCSALVLNTGAQHWCSALVLSTDAQHDLLETATIKSSLRNDCVSAITFITVSLTFIWCQVFIISRFIRLPIMKFIANTDCTSSAHSSRSIQASFVFATILLLLFLIYVFGSH